MAGRWRAFPLVCAVSSGSKTTLRVSSDVRDALLSMHARNIGVLGVFGPPASGKRLLLHTMLQSDFSAASEGTDDVLLWMWLLQDEAMKDGDKIRVVLSAGSLVEAENGQQKERQKLALLLLLSSALLYNADGDINAEAIERLQWLEDVARVLRVKGSQDEEAVASEFHVHAPKFIWLARNFKIKWLKDAEGQKLTPTEYFEQSVAPEAGYGEAATKRNMLRMYLESYFPVRACVALSRAVEGNGTDAVPPDTARSEQRTQFVEAVDELYATYLSDKAQQLPSKALMGHELRSEQFVTVLDTYVEAMNAGQLPTMQQASSALLEQELAQAFQVAQRKYSAEVQAVESSEKRGQDAETLNERELQLAHFRGVQAARAHVREVRSTVPEELRKTLFEDKLAAWEAQVKANCHAALKRNATLSADMCTKILERVLPRSLEAMATELAARPREDFSDGLIRLLTQYESDLRSAIDAYAQQGSGAAVATCQEEALLRSVRASIQTWGSMVLRQYKKHVQSWQEEKDQVHRAYELALMQDADTTASADEHKRSYEAGLATATKELSEMRRALHGELHRKKSELERLTTDMTTMNLKHEVRVKNAESDLAWARSRAEQLEKSIAAGREHQEEMAAAARQSLEKQRSFHDQERSLLVQQKELMAQLVQLERELVHKKTQHVQKLCAMQNEHAKKLDRMRTEQALFERQLKSQAKKDLSSLRYTHEKEKKALLAERSALDKEMAAIQDNLAAFDAQDEAARASAAATRDFFKSMPLMPLPLMQAPAPAAGEHQPARRSSKASTSKHPVRLSSFDDTSTSSASPITRSKAPQSNDMCKQS